MKKAGLARPMLILADFAQMVDDLEDALDLYLRAREIDQSQPHVWINIARLQARLGRFEDMEATFADCATRFGALPEVETAKAAMLRERGDREAGLEVLERAASTFPSHFEVWRALFNAHVDRGNFSRAESLLKTCPAATVREHGFASWMRAHLGLARWRLEDAAGISNSALKHLPTDPGVHSSAALCALLRIDVETARQRHDVATQFNSGHRVQHGGGWKATQTHDGQLIDEYRIDAPALEKLRAGWDSADPVAALASLVIARPDHTPSAIALMVALRRLGLLEGQPETSPAGALIPHRITQFWDEGYPTRRPEPLSNLARFSSRLRLPAVLQGSAQLYLSKKGARGVLAAFARSKEPAMKADIFRLAHLYFEGGYYLDADDRCVARLDALAPTGCDLLLYQENYGTVGNNFIGVAPDTRSSAGRSKTPSRRSTAAIRISCGSPPVPGLLTRVVASYLAEDLGERLRRIRVLEQHNCTNRSRSIA